MIIHKLIAQHLRNRDDPTFYTFQAQDAINWIRRGGVTIGSGTKALDLGCGHGIFGAELRRQGCQVTFADQWKELPPEIADSPFKQINLDQDELAGLGEYDLVICSNVLEHLARPDRLLNSAQTILKSGGFFYLSWTNWLSPWGGHEFSPFHYLGPTRGHKIWDRISKRKRMHTPYENLFPTYIGSVLKKIRGNPQLRVRKIAPRYYTELSFLIHIPVVREFLAWNCALLLERK
jgi:2-polyprenyl-3-methyl-5-hydroxy-6-metoxy-1,4-benzoquinol methylase